MKEITIKIYELYQNDGHMYKLFDDVLEVDGIAYKLPRKIKHFFMKFDKGKIYVDIYEFKDEKFKLSLKAIIYKLLEGRE